MPPACQLEHVPQGCIATPVDDLLRLKSDLAEAQADARAAGIRIDAAERRETAAIEDRREAERRREEAERRAVTAEDARSKALSALAETERGCADRVEAAVKQERESHSAQRSSGSTGLIEENRYLAEALKAAYIENTTQNARVRTLMDDLDSVRRELAELKGSRPNVQIEADKAKNELERARVNASVEEKKIASNETIATMLLTGAGEVLGPLIQTAGTKMLEARFPRARGLPIDEMLADSHF